MKEQVLIVGAGPGGTSAAMFLLKQGIQPLILEREAFPRYHIGESFTGAGGQILRELGFEQEMHRRGFPTKRGVRVFGQGKSSQWFVPVAGRDENWELFPWETWQARRSEFDKMMLDAAIARGAKYMQGRALRPLQTADGTVRGVKVQSPSGTVEDIQTEMLLDCSGQSTWLANLGDITGPKYVGAYDKQIAIFSQVANAERDPGGTQELHPGNTLIFYQSKFHWAWFIPLNSEVVSVGVVVPSATFRSRKQTPADFLTSHLKELHPDLARRIPEVKLVEDVHVVPNYSYQVKKFSGRGFMCLGDAHRFVDPIFSFGLTVTMREAQMAAPIVHDYLAGNYRDDSDPFAPLRLKFEKGIDVLEDVVDSFWEQPLAFAYCVYAKHTDHMTDMFAGRIYEDEHQPSPGLKFCRKLLNREGMRESSYLTEDLYSVPVGSRYHPERAPIWVANNGIDEELGGPQR